MLESIESKNHPTRFSNYFQALLELVLLVDKEWHNLVEPGADESEDVEGPEQPTPPSLTNSVYESTTNYDCIQKVNMCFGRLVDIKSSHVVGDSLAWIDDISPLLGTVNARRLMVIEGLQEHTNAKQIHDVLAGAFEPFGGLCSKDIYINRLGGGGGRPIVIVEARAMCWSTASLMSLAHAGVAAGRVARPAGALATCARRLVRGQGTRAANQ